MGTVAQPRLRFGLDLDGVIYDFHSAARFLLSQKTGKELPPTDQFFYKWDGHLDYVSKDDADWLWSGGVDEGLFRHGHVRKGAIEFVQELDKIADIVVITHRPRTARQDTLDWLSFHRIPTQEIHLLTNSEPKWTINVNCLLDDKYQNVWDFATHRGPGLLWSRVWNHDGLIGPFMQRMSSWQEVLSWVKDQNTLRTQTPRTEPLLRG